MKPKHSDPEDFRKINQKTLEENAILRQKLEAFEATASAREDRLQALYSQIKLGFWEWNELKDCASYFSEEMAKIFNLPQPGGALVQSVTSRGLGNVIGLKGGYVNATIEGKPLLIGGDIILEIAGIPLVGAEEILSLREKILSIKIGDSFDVTFLREGVIHTKEVTKE